MRIEDFGLRIAELARRAFRQSPVPPPQSKICFLLAAFAPFVCFARNSLLWDTIEFNLLGEEASSLPLKGRESGAVYDEDDEAEVPPDPAHAAGTVSAAAMPARSGW